MRRALLFLALAGVLSGCTSIDVTPVSSTSHPIKTLYIVENQDVYDKGFLQVIDDDIQHHGIATKVVQGAPPSENDYSLTYTAKWKWDLSPYLAHADLRIKQGGRLVGSAEYLHRGGYDLGKYESIKTKMKPVVDQLLAGFQHG